MFCCKISNCLACFVVYLINSLRKNFISIKDGNIKMCFVLQLVHMLILIWNNLCLLYMIYAAIYNRKGRILKIAYFSIGLEVLLLIMFGFECPLTLLQWYLYPGTSPNLLPAFIVKPSIPIGFCLVIIFFTIKLYKFYKRKVVMKCKKGLV